MATFQKKTSDLLKEQKASYSAMVKSALKGKTGLSRAEVNKTIRGVAKDYREQYGETPRKRYIKALAKVSAEGLEPIAAKSVKLKNAKLKAKAVAKPKTTTGSQQNAQTLEYLRKQQEATERRIKARSERIRQRTEAAVANHKAEQAKKSSTKAKAPEKTWKVGTHLQNARGNIYVIKSADLIPLKKPYWRYRLSEMLGSGTCTLDDKPEVVKAWRYVSPKEALKAKKKYWAAQKHADMIKQQAELKKVEAEEMAKNKAKYLTINETFIKQFATDLGLSTATIKAMYKVANDYRHDNIRTVMCGLYCDPEDYLVATDAHILVAIKCKMPAKYKGKIYLKSGMVENSKYPNWQMVMPIRSGVPNADYTHTDKYSASLLTVKGKIPADYYTKKDREYTTIKDAEGNKIGLEIECINVLDRLFKTLKANDIKIYTKSPSHSVLFAGKHFAAIQMPILLSK